MSWIFIALLVPALYSAGNYIDKALLSKKIRGGGVGSIILFSCFLGSLTIPIIYFIEPNVFSLNPISSLLLSFNGGLTVLAVLLYLYAIERDDISVIVPILQITPIFGFIIGFILLGELISIFQIVGSLIIILGAAIISMEISDNGNWIIKKRILLLSCGSAFVFALSGSVFKFFALDHGYWPTQFWEYVGIAIVGLGMFLLIPSYRNSFISVFKENKKKVIGLNFSAEVVMVSADLIMNFATLLAPIVLIYVVNSFQPAFVYIYGIILTFLIPSIIKEKLSKKHLAQKILTIFMMIVGSILLVF